MIELKGTNKIFQVGDTEVIALHALDLTVKKGEFLSVVGPSGSGKSTLLNLIGGIDKPTSGQVLIQNEDISEYDDETLSEFRFNKIGFIFQGFNLIPTLTALENVLIPTIPYKTDAERRARELLKLVGLGNRIHHLPNQLSGGQKQRVAIARALINQPEVLLADEPTGELDTKTGRDIVNLLQSLNKKEKTTMIIVTHDLTVAEQTNRIIHLVDGKISWDKPTKKVKIKEFLR